MAFVGLEASVITVFVLRILLDNFFPIILAKVEAFSTGSYSTNLSQTERKYIFFVCLFVFFFCLSFKDSKGFCCRIKGCSKGFSMLPFIPTWGCDVERNTVSADYLIIGAVQQLHSHNIARILNSLEKNGHN